MKKLLAGLLLSLLVLYGCGKEEEPDKLTNSQEEMFSYLPSGTQFILYMNLTELRKTEFWSDYFRASLEKDTMNNWLSDFEENTGSGLKEGISEVISATTWEGNDLFGVRFDKNLDKVQQYFLNPAKFSSEDISGKKVFHLTDGSDARFYFAKNDLLLICKRKDYVEDLAKGTGERFTPKDKLYSVIQKVKNKNHYWMATNKGGFAAGLINLLGGGRDLPVKKIISSVNEINLSARFSDGVDINSVWGCTDAEHAYLLSTGVRSALAMDLLAGKDYALNELLKKLEIDREAREVHFEINLDKEDLAGLKKLAEKKKLSQKL